MDAVKRINIIKISGNIKEENADLIVVEKPISIFVNYEFYAALMCSPSGLKELAAGFLFSEQVITSMDDIQSIEEKYGDRVCVVLNHEIQKSCESIRAISSGCGGGSIRLNSVENGNFRSIDAEEKFSAQLILELMKDFNNKSEIFKETGGVHSCALSNEKGIVAFSEDIGRHNALDKVIGKALMNGLELKDKFIMTSGRISSDIVIKTYKAGIPMIVSHSAPTDLALSIAGEANITIIGFARGNRMNIYCSGQRVY
ncbi:MAG: formate dehydrogenase accessory sulfurtransferase FdhD [Clostridiaceae bacterium]